MENSIHDAQSSICYPRRAQKPLKPCYINKGNCSQFIHLPILVPHLPTGVPPPRSGTRCPRSCRLAFSFPLPALPRVLLLRRLPHIPPRFPQTRSIIVPESPQTLGLYPSCLSRSIQLSSGSNRRFCLFSSLTRWSIRAPSCGPKAPPIPPFSHPSEGTRAAG